MSYQNDEDNLHKTGRIAILSILIFFIALLCFLAKVEACKNEVPICKEQLLVIDPNYNHDRICPSGAVAEIVTSPKPGVLCRCGNTLSSNKISIELSDAGK